MAVNVTTVLAGANTFSADVEATADGDTTAVIAHGLGATPLLPVLCALQQVGASLSLWAVTALDATNVTLTKAITGGSGVAGDQVNVTVALPHSLVR